MSRKYSCYPYTMGIKEYCIEFEDVNDAEIAYDRAIEWYGTCRGIFNAYIGDAEVYIVCTNEVMIEFLRYIEKQIDVEEGEL